jgi:hypothetical protein
MPDNSEGVHDPCLITINSTSTDVMKEVIGLVADTSKAMQ